MKVINNNVVEVLPNLLNKSKVQTIRPAFAILKPGDRVGKEWTERKAKYKVGEEVKIMWKQGSKDESFCTICGFPTGVVDSDGVTEYCWHKSYGFFKLMGKVEITEVFKIEMWWVIENSTKNIRYPLLKLILPNGSREISIHKTNKIAKADGFSSAKQMFKTIDKMYDLSSPKEFYVYRWKWL